MNGDPQGRVLEDLFDRGISLKAQRNTICVGDEMVNYSRGKVYKIRSKDRSYRECYIGSTTQELSTRFSNHGSGYKRWEADNTRHYVSSFDLFREHGIDGCEIVLIEAFQCKNNEELRIKEEEHRSKITSAINHMRCFVSKETRNEESKISRAHRIQERPELLEIEKARKSAWARDRRRGDPNFKAKEKQNNIAHRSRVKADPELLRAYKEKQRLCDGKKVICTCGSILSQGNLYRHRKSLKHLRLMG